MVSSKATTPAAYLASLEPERRAVIAAVRKVINANLPDGYVETMNWGMLSYEIPLSRYPETYNGQPLMYVALAAQKNNYALYMTGFYSDPRLLDMLVGAYKAAGRKLDMGKSCLRFKTLEEVPLDVVAHIVAATSVEERIKANEAGRAAAGTARAAKKATPAKTSKASKASASLSGKPAKSAKAAKPSKARNGSASSSGKPAKRATRSA
jgi:hypothetical protein